MRPKQEPNLKALKAFDFIVRYKTENDGNSPSFREIADAIEVKAVSHVHYLVQNLAEHGMIELVKGRKGCIRINGGQYLPPTGG